MKSLNEQLINWITRDEKIDKSDDWINLFVHSIHLAATLVCLILVGWVYRRKENFLLAIPAIQLIQAIIEDVYYTTRIRNDGKDYKSALLNWAEITHCFSHFLFAS